MRILFVTPYLPSLIRVRSYNFIKCLSKRRHPIHLLALIQDRKQQDQVEELKNLCEEVETIYVGRAASLFNCLRYLFSTVALQSAYCFSRKMSRKVREVLARKKFDIIHVEHIRGAHFLPDDRRIPAIFDSVDCITYLYRQFSKAKRSLFGKSLCWIEWLKLRRYEPRQARRYDTVLVTSDKDKEELLRLGPQLKIRVIGIGVSSEFFNPNKNQPESKTIIFSGKMSYYANEAAALFFCEKIFPQVLRQVPDARLYIVGKEPSRRVQTLSHDSNIIVTGYVEDMRAYLRKASLSVSPTIVGAGIQIKVLEAMAMRKPVVATSKACQALSVTDKKHLLIADDPKQFSEKVISMLRNPEFAEQIAKQGRKYIEENHDWKRKVDELESIYIETIKNYSQSQRLRISG